MATASSSSSILQPEQQQLGAGETLTQIPMTTPEAGPTASAWKSSGSIGPFFAVISVLAILAVLSCYLGRLCNRRPLTPLESIENRGCFGYLKLMCRRGITSRLEVGALNYKAKPKDMVCGEGKNDCNKVKDGEVAEPNLQPQA